VTNLGEDQLTVMEAARVLGRSTEQVRRYLREGVLPGQRIGGQWFIARADAESLCHRRQDPPPTNVSVGNFDPLGATIGVGAGGGGNIAAGAVSYLRLLQPREPKK
jgi:excisionase family DNA binding protein